MEDNVNLLDHLNIIFKRWRLIAFIFVSIVFFTGLFSIIKRPVFTAAVTLLPSFETQTGFSGDLSQLGNIASQFGLSPAEVGINSPLIYEKMLKSRELIDRVVQRKFYDPREKEKKTLIEIYKIDREQDPEKQLFLAYRTLLRATKVNIDNNSMTLSLSINARDPYLAADIANAMVAELDQYNREILTIKATTNKEFIEGRVTETQAKLKEAEEELKRFRQENRRIEDSPELLLQLGRLTRQVKLQEELFITLKREYELAKIQEIKDTPVIYTLGKARPPMEKSSPKRKLNILIAAIISLIIGVGATFVVDYAESKGWNLENLENTEGFKVISTDFSLFKQAIKKIYRKLKRKKGN
ncbi:hypothetical protein KAX02_01145 [candidate division WOR-3 bacterium]|nr:hypothetical protein [candidate division WOR-3 bacterium]